MRSRRSVGDHRVRLSTAPPARDSPAWPRSRRRPSICAPAGGYRREVSLTVQQRRVAARVRSPHAYITAKRKNGQTRKDLVRAWAGGGWRPSSEGGETRGAQKRGLTGLDFWRSK